MKLPEYISRKEVTRVCREMGIRDWSAMEKPIVSREEADIILRLVNTGGMAVRLEDFQRGLEVELEHGTAYPDANVTNNHPVLTGLIVMAHFKETLDYYQRLEVAELEGDMRKAYAAGDTAKLADKYGKLLKARLELAEAERY
ncbi:conserved hypothetical protein [Dehalogenimonas lykanthroporepellens BL-DC-9]|nr:conserved hypothetical protein [Dehalogenimonas lykanthroporepellens BL-DC-9]